MNHLESLAEKIRVHVPSHHIPQENTRDLFLLYALLAITKGKFVNNEDVHNAWCCWMIMHHQTHPSLVQYSELPEEIKNEDSPFVEAIRKSV
jgi:hypothetical protein